jgi:hypothetical protein
MVNIETLVGLKAYFDDNLQFTIRSITMTDSERLVRNKVEGFLISL